MNPQTGAPDASDKLRAMRAWLHGSPPGSRGLVQGELQLQQATTDQARLARIRAMVDASYPGLNPSALANRVEPTLPYWRVSAYLDPGVTTRASGQDTLTFVRVRLSISNSPLALCFTVDPNTDEESFRQLVRSQYAVIAAAGT